MRYHTRLHAADFYAAMESAKDSGKVGKPVHIDTCDECRSTVAARAFEVKLCAYEKQPGDKRRWKNTGNYGADNRYAATYAEHGWFMAELYQRDGAMRIGGAKKPVYSDRADFHRKTRYQFTECDAVRGGADTVCSRDIVKIWHGVGGPARACGKHAEYRLEEVAAGHRARMAEQDEEKSA